jgi:hypothetical protein
MPALPRDGLTAALARPAVYIFQVTKIKNKNKKNIGLHFPRSARVTSCMYIK